MFGPDSSQQLPHHPICKCSWKMLEASTLRCEAEFSPETNAVGTSGPWPSVALAVHCLGIC